MSHIIKKNEKLRLVQMTDLHFGTLPWNSQDLRTRDLMVKVSEKLRPDLIIFTGDNIWTEGVKDALNLYKEFLKTASSLGVPYIVTHGNHDSEGEVKRQMLHEIEEGAKNLTEPDGSFLHKQTGRKDKYLDIKNEEGKTVLRIFVIDSGDYGDFGLYAYLCREQGEFVREKLNDTENALIFMHIPLPEYWEGLHKIETGVRLEENKKISSPEINTGFFADILPSGKVRGIFAGHDHDNNFTFTHFGVQLGYGNVSGYNCYGELKRGVRVFEIYEDGKYTTGIITEDEME